jgi:hypothetical protein
VRQVVNQIALESERPPDGELDAWLTTKIKSRMAMDPDVRAMNIDVDTVEGVTYLTGIVEDKEERQNAERIASSVEGVERVVNNIKLEDEVYGPPDVEAQGPPGDPEQQKQKKQEQQKQEKEQEKEQEQEQEQEQEKAEEAPPPPPSPPQAG